MKRLPIFIALSVVMASCGSKTESSKTDSTSIIPVRTMALEQHQGAQTIHASGQFTTDDEVYLSFKTGGIINNILVKEGDAVHKGQLLATLNLTEINAQVQQASLAYEKAQRDFHRTQNLYNDSVATLEQLQNSKTAQELAAQQLSSARFNLTYSTIHATQDGYVLHKLANTGQLINAGAPVLQTNGARNAHWILRIGVSDKEWASVKTGNKASIEVQSLQLPGTVTRKSEGIDPQSGTFIIDVQLSGDKPAAIAAGMFGRCSIQTAAADTSGIWRIPYGALLDGNGSSGFVFVTNDNKTAQKVPVTIAGMEKDQVLISGGIGNAAKLIISGSAYLKDQSPIRIIQ